MEKDLLIFRHLDGSLSVEDTVLFNKLLNEDVAFKAEYENLKELWDGSKNVVSSNAQTKIDVNASWNDFEKLIQPQKATPTKRLLSYRLLRAAAIVILVLSSIFVIREFSSNKFEIGSTMSTLQNQQTCLSMNDGSDVYLDDHTSLEVDINYNREKRITRLSGTAFFVVKPDKDKVFEVVTSHLKTIVKGTTFLISTNDHFTTVGVQTGLVEVEFGGQTEKLRAGEQIIVSAHGEMIERSVLNARGIQSLKLNTKVFHDVTLSTILTQVELLYDIKIIADSELSDHRYTVDFSHVSKEQVVSFISTLTQTTYHKDGENYILKQ